MFRAFSRRASSLSILLKLQLDQNEGSNVSKVSLFLLLLPSHIQHPGMADAIRKHLETYREMVSDLEEGMVSIFGSFFSSNQQVISAVNGSEKGGLTEAVVLRRVVVCVHLVSSR